MLERRAEVERPVECGVTDVRELTGGIFTSGQQNNIWNAHS